MSGSISCGEINVILTMHRYLQHRCQLFTGFPTGRFPSHQDLQICNALSNNAQCARKHRQGNVGKNWPRPGNGSTVLRCGTERHLSMYTSNPRRWPGKRWVLAVVAYDTRVSARCSTAYLIDFRVSTRL